MQDNNSIPYDFINSFDEPVLFLSSNFTVQSLNMSAEKIFAKKANFIIGQSFSIFCPNFDNNTQKLLSGSITSCIGGKIITWRSISYTHPKDSIKFMLIGYKEKKSNLLPQKNDPLKKIDVSTYEDIKNLNQTLTGKTLNHDKDTLAHVKDIYHYMENIIAEIPVSVYWMNKECIYLGCSNSMAKLLKLASRHDIIGKTYADLYDEKSAECYRIADKTVMDTGVSLSAEEPLYSSDGTKNIYLSNKVPLRDSSGEIIGMLGISVDITERKKLESIKDDFISNMEHDLRTPFSGIGGMAVMLSAVYSEKHSELADFFKIMLESCTQWQQIHNRIFDALDTQQPIKIEELYLQDEIDNVKQLMSAIAKISQINLQVDYPQREKTGKILSDKLKISLILTSLVGNAFNFTEKGSITIKMYKKETHFVIDVIDTGIGIPEDRFDVIFEKFSKLSRSNKYGSKFKGLGLGLYISRRDAEKIGGKIFVRSVVGSGSVFTLILPIMPNVNNLTQET